MPNLNKVMLMGNLTRDPEMRTIGAGTVVANFSMAINRKWKNKDGAQQEETTFVDCEAFARSAEVIQQYVHKGDPLFIEGRLKLDQWQDKEGQKRSRMKVVVENFQLLSSRQSGNSVGSASGGSHRQENQPPAYGSDVDQADIPF